MAVPERVRRMRQHGTMHSAPPGRQRAAWAPPDEFESETTKPTMRRPRGWRRSHCWPAMREASSTLPRHSNLRPSPEANALSLS